MNLSTIIRLGIKIFYIFFGVNIEEVLQAWLEAIDDAFTVECY